MKRERIQFLVTCSIGYSTPAERREAISESRENVLAVRTGFVSRPVKATLVKPFRHLSINAAWAKMDR